MQLSRTASDPRTASQVTFAALAVIPLPPVLCGSCRAHHLLRLPQLPSRLPPGLHPARPGSSRLSSGLMKLAASFTLTLSSALTTSCGYHWHVQSICLCVNLLMSTIINEKYKDTKGFTSVLVTFSYLCMPHMLYRPTKQST
jgi:hypothetical protein